MLSTTENVIEIKPTNVTPKGFWKFVFYFMIFIGTPSFIFGGFIFFFIGIWALFIFPKNVKKNYTASYILTEHELTAYGSGGQVKWKITWSDIESLYIITYRWYMPKSLGIRLNNLSNFQESINQSQPKGFLEKFAKMTNNKNLVRLARLISKYDIMIPYQFMDRPAIDFAQLLYVYMENSVN
jgi:hypothetical protein